MKLYSDVYVVKEGFDLSPKSFSSLSIGDKIRLVVETRTLGSVRKAWIEIKEKDSIIGTIGHFSSLLEARKEYLGEVEKIILGEG